MADCACNIDCGCLCDDESPEFFFEIDRVAKKNHKCNECNRIIQKGEKYKVINAKYSDEFYYHKICSTCQSIIDVMFVYTAYGFINKSLEDTIYECDGNVSNECLSRLSSDARARVTAIQEKVWSYKCEDYIDNPDLCVTCPWNYVCVNIKKQRVRVGA